MNTLASIAKNLRELETSYGKIGSATTRGKADNAIRAAVGRIFPVAVAEAVPSVSAASGGSVVLQADLGGRVDQDAAASVSVSSVGTTGMRSEWKGGVTTVWPVVDLPVVPEEPAIVGDVNGSSGTFYPETVTSEPVEVVGGWPMKCQVTITGLAANRRHLRGTMEDGRTVCVERVIGREWKRDEVVGCRLIRAGAAPLFRIVPPTK